MKQRVVTGELFRDAKNMKGENMKGCITVRTPRPRPPGHIFWELVVLNFSDKEWKEHFRMSKTTFNYIADELRPVLEKETTNWKEPIHYKRRLAAVLWWLATPTEYRTVE